jgi:hypothetical protein
VEVINTGHTWAEKGPGAYACACHVVLPFMIVVKELAFVNVAVPI